MIKWLKCFFWGHNYKEDACGNVTSKGDIVGRWTLKTCQRCGKTKYQQHV